MFSSWLRSHLLLLTLFVWIGFGGGGVAALAQAETTVRLNVFGSLGLSIPPFAIAPPTLDQDTDDLQAGAEPLTYSNGAVASGIPCRFVFATPSTAALTLTGTTDAAGVCAFAMNRGLSDQSLTLESGSVASLTDTAGNGSGYLEYSFEGSAYPTNTDTYSVVDPLVPLTPDLTITPPEVYLGEPVVVLLPPVEFDNDTTAVGLTCDLEVTTPEQGLVVLRGVTDENGTLRFDSSRPLEEQGLTLITGDLESLTNSLGEGSGLAKCVYDNTPYPSSNPTPYRVVARPLTLQVPEFAIDPARIRESESLEFAAEPLLFSDDTVAEGVACTLTILTPTGSNVVLTDTTDENGICRYDPDAAGNWNLQSGNVDDIRVLGTGSAYMGYVYNDIDYQTSADTYEVYTTPNVPDLTINPPQVYPGEPITVIVPPVTFDPDIPAVGLTCELTLTTPARGTVVIRGVTDAGGRIVYDSSRSLAEQGLVLVSGDPSTLTAASGNGSGLVSCVYDDTNYPSQNPTPYVVNPPLTPRTPNLVIDPPTVYPDEPITVTLPPVRYTPDTPATGLACELSLTTPDQAVVVIRGVTDAEGRIVYDSSRSLSEQGLTLVSGDPSILTAAVGNGSGTAVCFDKDTPYPAEEPTPYQVVAVPLVPDVPDLTIDPPQVYPNEPVTIAVPPVTFDPETPAVGLVCDLTITTPERGVVVLRGVTDEAGVIEYDSSLSPADQGLTLVSGDPSRLTSAVGNGSGIVSCTYNETNYPSENPTPYVVNERPTPRTPNLVIDPPTVYPNEPVLVTLPPVTYDPNTPVVGLTCDLTLTTPDQAVVVVRGSTDGNGAIRYDSSRSLEDQGLTLVSGDPSLLTRNVGVGSGAATCFENDTPYPSDTPTEYTVVPRPVDLRIPNFTIDPERLTPAEDAVFAAEPAILTNDATAAGLPCVLSISTPNGTRVILSSVTNESGVCGYTTARTPEEQGWTLESGNLEDIKTLGPGSAYIDFTYDDKPYRTNIDTYEVYSPEVFLERIEFAIDPVEIEIGQPVTFALLPVRTSDEELLTGAACTLNLLAPDLSKVVFTGTTDDAGRCAYAAPDRTQTSRLRSLWGVDAYADVSVQSGNPAVLNTVEGNGSGFAEVVFEDTTVLSSVDTYVVLAQILEEDERDTGVPGNLPEFLVETVRTGGALGLGVLILGLVFLVSLGQTVLEPLVRREKEEEPSKYRLKDFF